MRTTRLIAVLVGLAAIAMVTAEASAMYHAGMGRFMQRDPGAGGAHRLGAGGAAAASGSFIPRDPTGSNQYADGMNLYQYVRSNPPTGLDPQGLARLQYSYSTVWITDFRNPNDNADQKAAINMLENDVENLLSKYGINAWRHGKDKRSDRMYEWHHVMTHYGVFSDHEYNLYHLENIDEWEYVGRSARDWYWNVDDVIVFVPGYIGEDGKVKKTYGAAHLASCHVIGVPRANYMHQAATTKAIWLAHEVLHHFLPTGWHDTEGIMHPSAENGLSDKLGCKTFEKLKDKGVTRSDVDTNHLIE